VAPAREQRRGEADAHVREEIDTSAVLCRQFVDGVAHAIAASEKQQIEALERLRILFEYRKLAGFASRPDLACECILFAWCFFQPDLT